MRFLSVIPCDKRIHMIAGVILAVAFELLSLSIYTSMLIIVCIAFCVEIIQKVLKIGTFSIFDALFVVIGGVLVYLPLLKAYNV